MGMQMAVGTLLFGLHVWFEFMKNYECAAVMPSKWEKEYIENGGSGESYRWEKRVWDPRRDGTPLRYRLMGMPAMWFTSAEALADLITYVSHARKVSVHSVCPQEIALLVLASEDGRREVQHALHHSKLYSAKQHHLVEEDGYNDGRSHFKSLEIELLFYDEELHVPGCKYPGEFSGLSDEAWLRSFHP